MNLFKSFENEKNTDKFISFLILYLFCIEFIDRNLMLNVEPWRMEILWKNKLLIRHTASCHQIYIFSQEFYNNAR